MLALTSSHSSSFAGNQKPDIYHISYFSVFWTRKPATIPIVVGSDAAQTPSRFKVFSSMFEATTKGGAHCKNIKEKGMWELLKIVFNEYFF